jgi:hypothetical protein
MDYQTQFRGQRRLDRLAREMEAREAAEKEANPPRDVPVRDKTRDPSARPLNPKSIEARKQKALEKLASSASASGGVSSSQTSPAGMSHRTDERRSFHHSRQTLEHHGSGERSPNAVTPYRDPSHEVLSQAASSAQSGVTLQGNSEGTGPARTTDGASEGQTCHSSPEQLLPSALSAALPSNDGSAEDQTTQHSENWPLAPSDASQTAPNAPNPPQKTNANKKKDHISFGATPVPARDSGDEDPGDDEDPEDDEDPDDDEEAEDDNQPNPPPNPQPNPQPNSGHVNQVNNTPTRCRDKCPCWNFCCCWWDPWLIVWARLKNCYRYKPSPQNQPPPPAQGPPGNQNNIPMIPLPPSTSTTVPGGAVPANPLSVNPTAANLTPANPTPGTEASGTEAPRTVRGLQYGTTSAGPAPRTTNSAPEHELGAPPPRESKLERAARKCHLCYSSCCYMLSSLLHRKDG